MSKQAKLFTTGGSQAVRLPAEFRFEGDQVWVTRDERTGDVILSSRPRSSWATFVALRNELEAPPADFLSNRQQNSATRDPFATWTED